MAHRPKYPKSFYDDGLGEILEWIDDEILVHSERANLSAGKSDPKSKTKAKSKTRKHNSGDNQGKQAGLYGENDVDSVKDTASRKRLKLCTIEGDQLQEMRVGDKKIEDKARGLINRLAAQTMPFVSAEFEKMFSTSPRLAVIQALITNVDSSIILKSSVAKRKIVAELMLLVSYLSHKINSSIGASLIHHLIAKFEELYKSNANDEDKRLDNITFCLANLYVIGLISANSMYELTRRICSPEDFRSKSVEVLLIVLKNIGFQLRKDNPSLMKQLILMSLEHCKQFKQSGKVDSRVEFIIEALGAIKNNNFGKIGNYGSDIDKDTIELTLKSLIKRTRLPETLNHATYNDMVNSANFHLLDLRVGEEMNEGASSEKKSQPEAFVGSKTEERICKALGLKKQSEKTIFSALLKVTDFVEASNILIGFGMNHCSDAMLVCIHVAIHEKKYNTFYYDVINNLCKYHRKYKIAAKFAIQDKIRSMSGMPEQRVVVFERLCFELIKSDAIPITVLKSVEWSNLDNSTKDFLTYLLTSISNLPDEERHAIMLKSDKRSSFAGAMRSFTNCFLEDIELFR